MELEHPLEGNPSKSATKPNVRQTAGSSMFIFVVAQGEQASQHQVGLVVTVFGTRWLLHEDHDPDAEHAYRHDGKDL